MNTTTTTHLFLKVRIEDHTGGRMTVILRNVSEDERFISGREIRNHSDGCGWSDVMPSGTSGRIRVIATDGVAWTQAMTEDFTYGGLIPDGEKIS